MHTTTDMVPLRGADLTDHPYGHEGILVGLRKVADKIAKGRVHDDVISWSGHKLVEAGKPSGNLARAEALFDAFAKQYAYMHDQRGIERMADAQLTLGDGKNKKPRYPGGDCFAEGTLLLTEGHRLVPIERIEMGTRIWGLNGWTEVLIHRNKGTLPVTVVTLNNGSQLRLTDDHKMNVLVCHRHKRSDNSDSTERPCSCPVSERTMEQVRVADLKPGMVLPSPERLPFGNDTSLKAEQAYVEGLYVADGWSEEGRFSISGLDGGPKEAQKREVEAICKKVGLSTYWHKKYISVNDAWWAGRMSEMGTRAPEKHLLSLDLAESQARETLRGVMADSGKNTCGEGRTFTTTSRLLAVQVRLLHKMLGVSCGWSHIEDHGGLGKNPIWRLTTRAGYADKRQEKLLRVREVLSEVEEATCYDIQTEDGMVYLPEHDVTVHNCDDAVIAYGAACEAAGIPTAVVGAAFGQDRGISHVLLMVSDGQGKWVYADPSAKGYKFGQYKTPTREIIIDTLSGEILCDDTMCSPRMAGRVLNDDALGSKFLSLSDEAPEGAIDCFDLGEPVLAPLGVLKGLGDVGVLSEQDRAFVRGGLDEAKGALSEMRRWFDVASQACKVLDAPPLGHQMLFNADDLQRAVNLEAMLEVAIDAWEGVLDGRRQFGLSESLLGADLVVAPLPSDTRYVGFDLKRRLPELYALGSNDRINIAKNTLGAFPILGVAIAVAVVTFSISGAVAADALSKAKQAEAAAAAAANQAEYELIKAGKTDELVRVQQARRLILVEQNKGSLGGQVKQAAEGVGDLAVKGFAAVGLFLLLREGLKFVK